MLCRGSGLEAVVLREPGRGGKAETALGPVGLRYSHSSGFDSSYGAPDAWPEDDRPPALPPVCHLPGI